MIHIKDHHHIRGNSGSGVVLDIEKKLIGHDYGLLTLEVLSQDSESIQNNLEMIRGFCQALQLRLQVEDKLISFYRLSNGEKLPIPDELLETVESQKVELEAERSARIAAEIEAQQEKLRIQQAIPKLRELGLSVEQIAEILSSTVAEIEQ